jgi:hypothetical protein
MSPVRRLALTVIAVAGFWLGFQQLNAEEWDEDCLAYCACLTA